MTRTSVRWPRCISKAGKGPANFFFNLTPVGTAAGPITLPYKGEDSAGRRHFSSQDFTPRYDLVPPCVVLQYQTNNPVDGTAVPLFSSDVYPAESTGETPFAMVVPIDLTGAIVVNQVGYLDCEPLACVGGTQAEKRAL